MPSTYTTNLGIEKIATGEQSGVWGDTTNTNLDLIDQAVNGIVSITLPSAGTSGSPNALNISDGSLSDGRNKFIEFVDGSDLGATAYVQLVPNDAEKIVIIRNSLSGGQSLIIFQGTYNASNDFEIANGKDVVLKFDGAGTGATVTQVFNDLSVAGITATTADINGGTVDGAVVGGTTAAAGTFTTLTATTLGGALDANNQAITNVDINSGAIDGTTIGASSAAAGTFTTLSATTLGAALDANNQAITNIDVNSGAIDGTTIGASSATAGTFTTLTATTLGGALNANSQAITNVDINSDNIDGTTIGGASAAVGTFTTMNATTVDLGDWTITESAGVLYFATGGVDKMKLDASGNLTVVGDVTAFGTV